VLDTQHTEYIDALLPLSALKAVVLKWEFEQINFVVGNRRSVVEINFYTKLKKLDVQQEKKAALRWSCDTSM